MIVLLPQGRRLRQISLSKYVLDLLERVHWVLTSGTHPFVEDIDSETYCVFVAKSQQLAIPSFATSLEINPMHNKDMFQLGERS